MEILLSWVASCRGRSSRWKVGWCLPCVLKLWHMLWRWHVETADWSLTCYTIKMTLPSDHASYNIRTMPVTFNCLSTYFFMFLEFWFILYSKLPMFTQMLVNHLVKKIIILLLFFWLRGPQLDTNIQYVLYYICLCIFVFTNSF